ncbi:hypothetical protein Cni_G01873 [Canna indica]|uniref:DUF4283 domain-containing protein n=1 Tax=Canna indica TaxID=4628 RepID=A0AAQ3PYY5_9LILI|nr:hypothetical protein Cni_G01873 [Canna indica]
MEATTAQEETKMTQKPCGGEQVNDCNLIADKRLDSVVMGKRLAPCFALVFSAASSSSPPLPGGGSTPFKPWDFIDLRREVDNLFGGKICTTSSLERRVREGDFFQRHGRGNTPRPKKPLDPEEKKLNISAKAGGSNVVKEGRKPEGDQRDRKDTGKGDAPFSWASLFRRADSIADWRQSYELKEKIRKIQSNAKGEVRIEDEEIDKARLDCKLVLYGKFFGRTPNLELVRNVFPKIWNLKSNCKILDLASDFFAFKFENEIDYWEVLSGGPWFLRGQALSLVEWKKNFSRCWRLFLWCRCGFKCQGYRLNF